MNKERKGYKTFLEQQLEWTKEQIHILDEMEVKLHEMKKIAEYAEENKLSSIEAQDLNVQLVVLKNEYSALEAKRKTVFH